MSDRVQLVEISEDLSFIRLPKGVPFPSCFSILREACSLCYTKTNEHKYIDSANEFFKYLENQCVDYEGPSLDKFFENISDEFGSRVEIMGLTNINLKPTGWVLCYDIVCEIYAYNKNLYEHIIKSNMTNMEIFEYILLNEEFIRINYIYENTKRTKLLFIGFNNKAKQKSSYMRIHPNFYEAFHDIDYDDSVDTKPARLTHTTLSS